MTTKATSDMIDDLVTAFSETLKEKDKKEAKQILTNLDQIYYDITTRNLIPDIIYDKLLENYKETFNNEEWQGHKNIKITHKSTTEKLPHYLGSLDKIKPSQNDKLKNMD